MKYKIGDQVRNVEMCGYTSYPDRLAKGEHTFTAEQMEMENHHAVELMLKGQTGKIIGIHHWRIPCEEEVDNYIVEWERGRRSILPEGSLEDARSPAR